MRYDDKLKNKCAFHIAERLKVTKQDVMDAVLKGTLRHVINDDFVASTTEFAWAVNGDFTVEFDYENNSIKSAKYRYTEGDDGDDVRLKAMFATLLLGYSSLADLEPVSYPCTALLTDESEIKIIGEVVTNDGRNRYLISENIQNVGSVLFDLRGLSQNKPKFNKHIVLLKEDKDVNM